MRLLNICDPSLYGQPEMDVPTLYQRFARDPHITFFHAPVEAVTSADHVAAVAVPETLTYGDFCKLDRQERLQQALSDFDLVFCRRLKPFPDGYLDQLRGWAQHTRFINDPVGKQEQMQPDFLQRVAGRYTPEMLVTADLAEAFTFFEQHQTIVAKQTNSCGGRGVFKIWYEQQAFWVDNSQNGTQCFRNFAQVMQALQGSDLEPLQFVRYLKGVTAGDKRVVVVDGEIYGAYTRRSRSGYWVNNVSVDGECELAEVTRAEREAIEGTVGEYCDRNLHTLGYDFLLDDQGTWRISEINAGNIGGFARLEALTGERTCDRLIDWMLKFAGNQAPQPQRSESRLVESSAS
ncbi:Glutathione synthetase [Acaryochloris thomasi RCC1774]|uniref:Glutathione synthetase n=1 Tax=Acaryochloris thomasi RCC1774 TaxID=1764569 RepID=A0A2W1JM57_9CYAN|nr:YheC/YheD family protein [Acaryochloris thomasi]PZD71234.1 Glutathione synthetase [Acaryochloris thomasi RCC1774]